MSEEWWPDDTATPPPDGTHRVVQQSTEGVSLFLKAPADPTAHPFWTPEHAEAGAWSCAMQHGWRLCIPACEIQVAVLWKPGARRLRPMSKLT